MPGRRCSAFICDKNPSSTSYLTERPCHYKGVVERHGGWYCRRHDPLPKMLRNIPTEELEDELKRRRKC